MPDKQPYTLENPEPRKVEVEKNEDAVEARVSPARPEYALDFSDDVPLSESRVQLDVTVGPTDPNAVIVPPEGRGTHPKLGLDAPTANELLASGDADEATGVEDGKVVTSSDAAKRDEDDKS
jgi:hypothetical protein